MDTAQSGGENDLTAVSDFGGILASTDFLKTGISVSGNSPKLHAHLRPKSRPRCGRLASETPACGQVCGKKWLGWCGEAPAVSPAHFSVCRTPSEIRPKPLRMAKAAIAPLPRSRERTQRLTGVKTLEAKNLVAPAEGRGRTFALTDSGRDTLARGVALWEQAQAGLREKLGAEDAEALLRICRKLQKTEERLEETL